MDNGSRSADQAKAPDPTPIGIHDQAPDTDGDIVAAQPVSSPPPTPPAADFFRANSSSGAMAAYAKQHARQSQPISILASWGQAAQARTLPWALFPVAIAGAYIWAQHNWHPLQLDRLIIVAIAAVSVLIGVNLLRNAARDTAKKRIVGTPLSTTLAAQVSLVFFAIGVLLGLDIARWIGPGGIFLSLVGLALAGGYALLPNVFGAFPGEELVPALTLGPGLFFLALATQHLNQTAIIATHQRIIAVNPATRSAWLIALGLGALYLAAIIASRLRRDEPIEGTPTTAVLGFVAMRYLLLGSILAAYGLVVAAGLPHQEPHATLIVLLSLPVAIIPLTGAWRAKNPAALYIVLAQTQRLVIQFGLWLLGGLLLAGAYLSVVSTLHNLPGFH